MLIRFASRELAVTLVMSMLLVVASSAAAQTVPSGGMLRYPDVSQDAIVFVYANDLWVVDRDGGMARPLASPAGQESFPKFSADGKTIAFVGNYEGGRDLYTIAASGGIANRVTYDPASERMCDWHGDQLLYFSNAQSGLSRQNQLFLVSSAKPLPQRLPIPYGDNGAISDDGTWLAYTPWSRDTRTWKRYRGGMASDIWLFNLKNNTSKRMTDWEGTDSQPMWSGQTVYYLSDAGPEHKLNIWAYDTATGARRQVTEFTEFDVKWPSMGPDVIVLQNGSQLYLVDLESGEAKPVAVTIPGDRPTLRPKRVDAAEFISGAHISPQAKRVAVEARGDIWTLPAKNGSPYNLTRSSGVAERDPGWSPDGQWIAYFADITGEYELYVKQSDGRGETRRLTEDGDCYRYSPNWSPDSKKIVFTDKTGAAWMYDLESKTKKQVDVDPWASQLNVSWSHDSQWLTYVKQADDRGGVTAVWIYEVSTGKKRRVTSGRFADSLPTFDRKGAFIFFASSRSFAPMNEDLGTTFIYTNTEVLVAMPLRADVKNPLLPKSDEETWKDEEADDDKKEPSKKKEQPKKKKDGQASPSDKKSDDKKSDDQGLDDKKDQPSDDKESDDKESDKKEKDDDQEVKKIKIEFKGMEQRAFQLPVPRGIFTRIGVNDKGHVLFASRPPRGSSGAPTIRLIDLNDDKRAVKTVVSGAAGFLLTPDGKKMLVSIGRAIHILATMPDQKPTSAVPTAGMMVMIQPREEWKQMFMEVWRVQRDFFYDPKMHGVDWKAVRTRYEKMLDDCVSREDVSFVMGEMISELNVGHAYLRPGDGESAPSVSVGVPGALFEAKNNAYRISHLHEGATWDVDARNVWKQAGIKKGDYLLAVNGVPVTTDRDVYAAFQGLGNSIVTVTVASKPKAKAEQQRHIVVQMPTSDRRQRYRQWIERNRAYVDKKSKGRIGYVYVPNTGIDGQNDLVRQFYGQLNKDALIIDDRWNGGGQIPTRFIELLNRPVTNYWARRDGRDWTWPPDAHQGPKAMLINGLAGSGGDMFPALFRQAGLGKLIGMRTWGGLVGISGNPSLVDGGSTTAPTFAYYEKDGTWGIEGHGVDPDIEVVDDPAQMVDGGDPQLDAAIEHLQQELKQNAYKKPPRPKYPDRSKFGLDEADK